MFRDDERLVKTIPRYGERPAMVRVRVPARGIGDYLMRTQNLIP